MTLECPYALRRLRIPQLNREVGGAGHYVAIVGGHLEGVDVILMSFICCVEGGTCLVPLELLQLAVVIGGSFLLRRVRWVWGNIVSFLCDEGAWIQWGGLLLYLVLCILLGVSASLFNGSALRPFVVFYEAVAVTLRQFQSVPC